MAHIDADQGGWVAVEDDLPDDIEMVMVFVAEISDGVLQSYSIHKGWRVEGEWFLDCRFRLDAGFVVTHWMARAVPDRYKEIVSTWQ